MDGLSFRLLDFPDNEEFITYLSSHGHSLSTLQEAKQKWESNDLHMEIPSFWELFAEHATAPFFVFQVCFLSFFHIRYFLYYYGVLMIISSLLSLH